MFSKKLACVSVAAALLLMGSACGVQIGERPLGQAQVAVGSGQVECFAGAGKTLGDYFRGGTSDKQIADIFACTSRSLELFQNRIVGDTPGQYKPEELRTFMERYFLKGFEISDEMMNQVMKLKTTLIGGRVDLITTDDLTRLRQLLDIFHDLALSMQPYLPLTPQHLAAYDRKTFDAAIATLMNTSNQLGQVLQQRTQPYSLDDFDTLLAETAKFIEDPEYKADINNFRNNLPFMRQLKKVLISPDPDEMTESDWHLLLDTSAEMYSVLLRTYYAYHNDTSLYYGQGLQEVMQTSQDGYALLSKIIDRNPNQIVAFDDLDRLIDRFDPDLFNFGDPAYTAEKKKKDVKDFLRVLIQKYLKADASILSREGLRRENLDRFWELMTDVYQGQNYLEATLRNAAGRAGEVDPFTTRFDLQALVLPSLSQDDYLLQIFKTPGDALDPVLKVVSTGLRGLFQNDLATERPSFFVTNELQMTIGREDLQTVAMSELFERNWLRAAARFGLRAYAADPKRLADEFNGGLTEPELRSFYNDLQPIGVDIDLFDPNAVNSDKARLREADIFTFNSNGDGLLSITEAADLVELLVSTKVLSTHTYDQMFDECRHPGIPPEKDPSLGPPIFNKYRIELGCYMNGFFRKGYAKIWDHLPDLLAYYESLPSMPLQGPTQPIVYRETFGCLMGDVALTPLPAGEPRQWVDSSDTDQFSAFAQYVESLMVRFDTDHSGTITTDEAKRVFPVLKLYLKQAIAARAANVASAISSDDDLFAVLTYLLAYGTVPSPTQYLEWRIKSEFTTPQVSADRGRIVQILSMLSSAGQSHCFDVDQVRRDFTPAGLRK